MTRDLFAALEHDRRRNAANIEGRRCPLRAIGVELRHQRAALIRGGDLVDCRRHHLTGTAPIRVEVDQHRHLGLLNRTCERLVVEREGAIEQHRLPALAALGTIGSTRGVDAIPRLTELTAQREMFGRRYRPRLGHACLQMRSLYCAT